MEIKWNKEGKGLVTLINIEKGEKILINNKHNLKALEVSVDNFDDIQTKQFIKCKL